MSKKKNKVPNSVNPAHLARRAAQGQLFLTLDFYRRNWLLILFGMGLVLAYIAQKYETQSNLEKVMQLSVQLEDAKTDYVNSSARYNSMIRESNMREFVDTMHINLTSPEQPPYKLSM